MKSYTDIEQSKKLAEFLPLESADHFHIIGHLHTDGPRYEVIRPRNEVVETDKYWPCWSLAALLKYLSEIKPQVYTPVLFPSEGLWILQFAEYGHGNVCEIFCDNPIDACVAMIEKLHELNLI